MIEEITIKLNGIYYTLVENPNKNLPCSNCDLSEYCKETIELGVLCTFNFNKRNYIFIKNNNYVS